MRRATQNEIKMRWEKRNVSATLKKFSHEGNRKIRVISEGKHGVKKVCFKKVI